MQVGYETIAMFEQDLASLRVDNAVTLRCYKHGAAEAWQVSDTHH